MGEFFLLRVKVRIITSEISEKIGIYRGGQVPGNPFVRGFSNRSRDRDILPMKDHDYLCF